MRKKRIPLEDREDYDVLSEFPGNEDPTDDTDFLTDRGRLARSAGVLVVFMILLALAFGGGLYWGASREFTIAPGTVWDIVLHIGFIVGCGLAAAAVVAAIGALIFGIPYARRRMAEEGAHASQEAQEAQSDEAQDVREESGPGTT
ncbi:MAG: hypothetical protein Q4G67_14055 [Actinomycetia bacterium]|nr:hypothetical protein [Actinomycetes bacterium]